MIKEVKQMANISGMTLRVSNVVVRVFSEGAKMESELVAKQQINRLLLVNVIAIAIAQVQAVAPGDFHI